MLRAHKKLRKKEIKEDALVTLYFRFQKWYAKYNRQIQIGLGIVAALCVIAVLMARSKREAEAKASGKIGIAETYYLMGDYSRVIQEMQPIVKTYSGTRSAGIAAYYLASAYYAQNQYSEAEKYFRMVVDHYAHIPIFSASSLAGLAEIAESRGDFATAAKFYERAARKYSTIFTALFYLKEAVRCYLQIQNTEKAKMLANELIKKYPENPVMQEIQWLRETL